jgi:hypothetical protein
MTPQQCSAACRGASLFACLFYTAHFADSFVLITMPVFNKSKASFTTGNAEPSSQDSIIFNANSE